MSIPRQIIDKKERPPLSFFFIPVRYIFPDHLPDIIKMQIISRTVGANHFIIIAYYHTRSTGFNEKEIEGASLFIVEGSSWKIWHIYKKKDKGLWIACALQQD